MDSEKKVFNVTISAVTVIKIILIFILFYFLYLIRDILMILFISLIFASAVDPWIDWLQKKKIPRGVSILLIYLAAFFVLALTTYLIVPPIAKEIGDLAANFPRYIERVGQSLSRFTTESFDVNLLQKFKDNLGTIGSNLQQAASGIFTTVISIFGGIVSLVLVMVITFYMVVEESAIKKLVWSLAPAKQQEYLMNLINRMQRKIGLWLRGQMILSLAVFAISYTGLKILGVKYALVLALIAGIAEAVPYLGPILGAIPAVFLSFTQAPLLAVFVGIFYYFVQLVENNILVPKIMQKTVGLNPIISISVLMIGFSVGGVAGAILSIPVATAVSVVIGDIVERRRGGKPIPEF